MSSPGARESVSPTNGVSQTALGKLADFAFARRKLTILLWVVALAASIGLSAAFAGNYRADYSTPESDSKAASDLIVNEFPGTTGDTLDVVWRSSDGAASPAAKKRLGEFFEEVQTKEGVGKTPGVAGARLSEDGEIALVNVPLSQQSWDFMQDEAQVFKDLASKYSGDGVQIELAGSLFEGGDTPRWPAYIAALIILLIAFGTVVASGLPIITAAFGLGVGATLVTVLAAIVAVPDWAPAVADLLAIGVGIDYALLVLTRFRDALDRHGDTQQALREAVSTAGRSVLIAGTTVVIAVMGLFLVGIEYMRGVAMATSITILVVMFTAITLLPALLAILGHRVNKWKLPGVKSAHERRERENDPDHLPLAARWSRQIQRRPWPMAVAATLILLVLALPMLNMDLGFPDASNNSVDDTTYKSYKLIEKGFGAGENGPLVVAVNLGKAQDPKAAAQSPDLAKLRKELSSADDVVFVTEPQVNPDGSAALMIVTPERGPQSASTENLVDNLRDNVIPSAVAGTGTVALVGGATPAFIDQSDFLAARAPTFIIGVVLLSLLILLVAFRSPIIAIKAGIMNLLSVGASYGVVTLASQGGWFGQLLGIEREVPIAPFVPVIMFAILFGLSMDYEVFLMSRVREEYLKGRETHDAVTIGLARTARVITAAAAIMIVVFLSFALSPEVFLRLMGIGMATAVLVDVTIVRMVLVPAVLQILGERNWWIPKWMDRVLPQWDLEPGPEPEPEPSRP